MIPDEAVQAAHQAWREQAALDGSIFEYNLRAALEAAAPHMLSHEREETRLAHLDAVVNAETVDKLQATLDRVEALAAEWEEMAHGRTQFDSALRVCSAKVRAAITPTGASSER